LQQRMKRGLSGTSRLHDLFVNIEWLLPNIKMAPKPDY
jgi:hypothetical protein